MVRASFYPLSLREPLRASQGRVIVVLVFRVVALTAADNSISVLPWLKVTDKDRENNAEGASYNRCNPLCTESDNVVIHQFERS